MPARNPQAARGTHDLPDDVRCEQRDRFFHVPGSPYAVLSLGSYCPNGSLTVIRHFDAEDPRIGAYPISSTNIDWSAEGLPRDVVIPSNAGLKAQRGDVQMTFCLFDGLGYQTGPMPALGFDYGVFAPSGVSFAIATGTMFTDDQDGAWQNEWCHDISTGTPRTSWNCLSSRSTFRSYGGGALEGADNTWLRLAKVKGTVCGDWLCNGTETCSTCQHDCGVCPVCPNGICEGGEYCPQDCGVCGDGICTGSETCSTCCGDCGTCTGEPWSCQQN